MSGIDGEQVPEGYVCLASPSYSFSLLCVFLTVSHSPHAPWLDIYRVEWSEFSRQQITGAAWEARGGLRGARGFWSLLLVICLHEIALTVALIQALSPGLHRASGAMKNDPCDPLSMRRPLVCLVDYNNDYTNDYTKDYINDYTKDYIKAYLIVRYLSGSHILC